MTDLGFKNLHSKFDLLPTGWGNTKTTTRQVLKFYFSLDSSARRFILPLSVSLHNTNRVMNTAVTIALTHEDTSTAAVEGEEGHTDTNTVTDRQSLKERINSTREHTFCRLH